jgi:hypothetical protein
VNVRRLGLCVCALLIASLAGGAVQRVHAAAAHASAGYAGPARGRTVLGGVGSLASRNWDGYVALPLKGIKDFNVVKSTWVEPTVTCEAKNAWTVFWVGIDGWGNDTVEQGGSSARCINSVPHYTLWWEMYPTNSIQTMNLINPGDTITASVTFDPTTKVFQIKVRDVTMGKGFTENEKCASDQTCQRASAEAIAEDVGHFGAGTYFPLADYRTMTFTKTSLTDVNGTSGGFTNSAWQYAAITEQDPAHPKRVYATVSALSDHGKSFSATWVHQ